VCWLMACNKGSAFPPDLRIKMIAAYGWNGGDQIIVAPYPRRPCRGLPRVAPPWYTSLTLRCAALFLASHGLFLKFTLVSLLQSVAAHAVTVPATVHLSNLALAATAAAAY